MAYPLSLPISAAIALVGAGVGIHLGRDSVAQINPSFYAPERSSTFYASLVPNAPDYAASAIVAPQHPDAVVLDGGGGCASCGLAGQAVYVADGAGYDAADAQWDEPDPVEYARHGEPVAAPDPALAQLVRYAHPAVEEEPVEPVELAATEAMIVR